MRRYAEMRTGGIHETVTNALAINKASDASRRVSQKVSCAAISA
jgi:hypothetical protein